MAGSNNILQWNPGAVNQETDSLYAADGSRTGGAANPSIFTSQTGNKLFYQVTTFLKAFGDALAAKGYAISDANVVTLAGVLANVTTQVDLSAALAIYAKLVSPALAGTPTAPTPASGDNSGSLATTAFVKGQGYLSAITNALVLSALGYTPVQQGGGAGDLTNKVILGWDGARVRAQVDNSYQGQVAYVADLSLYSLLTSFGNSLAANGFQKLPGGVIIQWTNALSVTLDGSGHASGTWTYATAYPNVDPINLFCPFSSAPVFGTVTVMGNVGSKTSVAFTVTGPAGWGVPIVAVSIGW